MENIVLSPEEMERQKELFEYEMTQVILNLKGKYAKYNRSNSPIKDSQEFADAVIGRHLDYIPLYNAEFDVKFEDIPIINNYYCFNPISEYSTKLEYDIDKQKCSAAIKPIEDITNKKIEIEVESYLITNKKVEYEYSPYLSKKDFPTIEIAEGLSLIHSENYKPFNNVKAEKVAQNITLVNNFKEYVPFTSVGAESNEYTAPKSDNEFIYKPYTTNKIEQLENVHINNHYEQYSAFEFVNVDQAVINIPTLDRRCFF